MPLWMIYPVIFAALYASHFSLLAVPYYWDEAGYYIPAAWDFFRTGSLIPFSTLTNAHPPLPSIYLALWWKAAGFLPEVTREAVLMVAALGLLAVWRLAMRLVGVVPVAVWTVVLTGLYPVWFAQSSLAHADIFAAACTLWGLVYALPLRGRNPVAAALWFAAAGLSKETSIAIPVALAVICLVRAFRLPRVQGLRAFYEGVWLACSALPLAVWYAYHRAKTGFLFGNPEFLRYNAQANLSPLRFLAAFGHRVLHLTAHMNLFVPVLMACAAFLLAPRPDAEGYERASIDRLPLLRILVLLAVEAVLFSLLGGALLTRYLLPMFPLVLLLVVVTLYRRVPYWQGLAVVAAVGFAIGLFVNPPYGFAPEDNLAYARFVRLHVEGIRQLEHRYPAAAHDRRVEATGAGLRKGALRRGGDRRFFFGADRTRGAGAGSLLGGAGFLHQVRSAFDAVYDGRAQQGAGRAVLRAAPRFTAGGDCAAVAWLVGVEARGPGYVGGADPL
jgi:hypothetical protein